MKRRRHVRRRSRAERPATIVGDPSFGQSLAMELVLSTLFLLV